MLPELDWGIAVAVATDILMPLAGWAAAAGVMWLIWSAYRVH